MAVAVLQGLGRFQPATMVTPFLTLLIVGGLAMHWLPPRAVEGMAERLKTAPSLTLGILIGVLTIALKVDDWIHRRRNRRAFRRDKFVPDRWHEDDHLKY